LLLQLVRAVFYLQLAMKAGHQNLRREVQKIVERPVYHNDCFDSDGMQQLNSLIKADSTS